jgi:hypothetical protein
MFSKKHPALFISSGFIEPGTVTLSRELLFEGNEALPYNRETFPGIFKRALAVSDKGARIVLSEELVYVTTLLFPADTKLTRELVRSRAEETVPEDLRTTAWDFRTMRYRELTGTEGETLVQVAVIEGSFSDMLSTVFSEQDFSVEAIFPESSVLASLVAMKSGVTVIMEQDRERTLFIACESDLVLSTQTKEGVSTYPSLKAFLMFVSGVLEKKIETIVLSHVDDVQLKEALEKDGYAYEEQSLNPLLGAFFLKVSGRDESVLNLNAFSQIPERSWWRRFL